jgi:YD repeat-containing protein
LICFFLQVLVLNNLTRPGIPASDRIQYNLLLISGSAAWSYDDPAANNTAGFSGRMSQENKLVGTTDKFTTQWAYNAADRVVSMSYPMKDLGQVDDPGKERLDSTAHFCLQPPDGA